MIEAPRHIVSLGGGRVRVLRLVVDGAHTWPLRYEGELGYGLCRYCGCSGRFSCLGHCAWAEGRHDDCCTRCYTRIWGRP